MAYNLSPEFYNFIDENCNNDTVALRLKYHGRESSFNIDFAILQIECRKKTKTKLKDFINNPEFLFPDTLAAEQSSHQAIARYHAALSGKVTSLLDMTAGLGIDTLTLTSAARKIVAIDLDCHRIEILKHNAKSKAMCDLDAICGDSIEYLKNTDNTFDIIFVDPSRRDARSNRLYNLRDCCPDIIENRNLIYSHAKRVLVKASPMLDIHQTLIDLPDIISIKAVGVKGECKEILIDILPRRCENSPVEMEAINLDSDGTITSSFRISTSDPEMPLIYAKESDILRGAYLLEPSAMVMKLSPWNAICHRFNAKKLGKSSHLFICRENPEGFPGRVTKIEKILKKKDLHDLEGMEATVVSRNHPLSAAVLRKELCLKEGEMNFIYATRSGDKPIFILSSKSSESKT